MDLNQNNFEYFYENSMYSLQSTFCDNYFKDFIFKVIKQEYITDEQFNYFTQEFDIIKNKELNYLFNEEIYKKE